MSVLFKKTIATSLIMGLVFPLTSQAQWPFSLPGTTLSTTGSTTITGTTGSTTLNTTVTTDTGTQNSNSQNLAADEDTTPQTNLNNLAPTYSQQSGNTVTTITPEIDLLGVKKEGRWSFGVARYSEIGDGLIKYDATGPKCPPAPTINEYSNGKDYYADNGFYNPWPKGLDGEWANDIIYFENDDPSLCRDQITIDSKAYVQKNYNPSDCSDFTYHEDQEDCAKENAGNPATLTLPLAQMSGCKRTDTVSVQAHKIKQDFSMYDKADNSTLCFAPEAKIDRKAPVISSFQAEHIGLGLAKETLSINSGNRTNYRADDGPLLLHVNLKDADADTDSGRSGLNWEEIENNEAIEDLQDEIRTAENQLSVYRSDAVSFESDIILKRSDILKRLASIQKHKVSSNLLHKISADINVNTNFFMQALLSLTPGLNDLNSTDINESGITNIQSILNRSKFDSVSNIETHRSTVGSINQDLINRRKGDYTTELPQLLSRAQVTEVGDFQSLTSTTNEFNQYYNQWQIDKTKNYSDVLSTWVEDIQTYDKEINETNDEFQEILAAYNSDDLLTLVQKLADTLPESSALGILLSTETSATDHAADQIITVQSLERANDTIQDTIDYLNSFDDSTDTFDNNIVSQLTSDLDEASNNILGIRGDLRDTETPGTIADSLYRMSSMEDTGEFDQLINLENQNARNLQAELVIKKDELKDLETKLQTKTDAIVALESLILTMRSELSALVLAHTDEMKGSKTETSTIVTTETKTVNEQIEESCTADGGTVVKAGSTSFCQFNADSCSGEWSQYKNWSTTENVTAADGNYAHVQQGNCNMTSYGNMTNGVCAKFGNPNTGSHNWANKPRETTTYTLHSQGNGMAAGCGERVLTYQCQAKVTQIGCTISGLTPITTTSTETVTTEVEPDTFDEQNITHIEITRSNSVSDKSQEFFPPSTEPETNEIKDSKTETSTIVTTETKTVNEQIEESCTADGGTVVKAGSTSFCRFNASSCSGGWSQYQNWSTTTQKECESKDRRCYQRDSCKTGKHAWSNKEREECLFKKYKQEGGGGPGTTCLEVGTNTCSANVTQIGCTIDGLSPITTTSTETVTTAVEPKNGGDFVWDINSYRFSGESAPIFTVAGNYQVSVIAFDKAKNRIVKNGYVKIFPAKLEVDVNSNCNNGADIKYADNTETCSLTMPQLDRFGNKVQSDKEIQVTVRDQDINGSYDLVKSLGDSFVNGLRFVGGSDAGNQNVLAWDPNNQASKTIQLKSLLPTLEVIEYGADPDYAIGYEVSDGVDVAFALVHPNIGPRGSILSPANIDTLNIPVRFKPWINLTAKGAKGTFTNRGWNPAIAKPFNIYVDADTNSSKKLPEDFVVNVTGFVGSSYEFNNQDLAKPGQSRTFNSVNTAYTESTGNAGKPAPFTTTINSISALSSQQSSRALFIPKVAYQTGGETVVLPGIPAGSCPDNDPEECFVIEPVDPEDPANRVDINISNASTNEPGNLNFTINLSESLEQDLTVYLEAEHITTKSGDFVMPTQNFVTISAGSLSASFSVAVPNHEAGEVEEDETMRLKVQNVDKPELVDQKTSGIGTIYDQDNALDIEKIGVIEGARCMFSFSISRPAEEDIIITTRYGDPSDSAQGGTGQDYDNSNGTFTISAGQTRVLAPVQTYEDDIAEGTEIFTLIVENVQGGDLSALAGETTCEIEDNDIEPNIYLSNTTVDEGNNASITVTLGENNESGRPDNEDVVVRLRTYEINNSTLNKASKDIDYVHKTFDVTIPANQKSVTVPVANGIVTNSDDLIEGDEYFGVEIIGITNGAKVGSRDAKALITIRDKSEPPAKPSIATISGETGYETTPNDTVKFTVTLNTKNDTGAPINLTLNLEDDTATGGTGQDYDNAPVTVSIPDGEKSGTSAPIEIYNDDIVEETEFFKAVVASNSVNPTGALTGTFPTGTAEIQDEDISPIDIAIEDSIACESVGCVNAEDNVMNFEVKLSTPHLDASNPLVVSFEPSKVTPTANDYFVAGTYTATFNYLDKVASLDPVPLINNLDVDGDKEFQMRFKAVESSHSSLIGDTNDTAKGTIQDDDSAAQPEIIITEASETEGNSAVINVGLTTPAIDETTITLTTRNISTEDADYSCLPEELTVIFGAGEMEAQAVQCDLIPDGENEPDEQFEIEVGTVTGTIKPGGDNDKGIITIINYQTLDLVMEEPPVFMENLEGGKAEFVIKLKDDGQPLEADQILERPITFTITPSDLGIGYGFAEGGSNFAINGTDYRNAIQTVNLEPGKGLGKTAYTIEVDINNDSLIEFSPDVHSAPENKYESFGMPINTSSGNVESITTHDAIIEDEDSSSCTDKPKVKVVDDSRVEGEDLQFYVALDRSLCSGEEITLDFETENNSAKAPADYTAKTLSLTFKNGANGRPDSQTILVNTIDDSDDENGESMRLIYVGATPSDRIDKVERFSVRSSDASHRNRGTVNAGGIAAIGTITDNDTAADSPPTVTISDALANEGEDLLYEVKLSETNKGDTIEAEFEATPGDANTTTADFSSGQIESGKILATMIIEKGEQIGTLKTTTNKHAVINTTENNITGEPDKKVYLDFLRRVYGRIETTGIAGGLGTIKDDDTAISKPTVTISDGAANEGEDITFTISLQNTGSGTNVAPRGGINFTIVTGVNTGPNAAEASEFGSGKVVSLPEGDSSVSFKIETYADDEPENAEHFNVQIQASDSGTFLDNAAAITSGNVNGTGTINDVTPPDECIAYGINCPEAEIILPGAAIEGQIIADKMVCLDENGTEKDDCDVTNDDSVVLGVSTVATDIREEITRNTYELIRGRTAANIGDIPSNTNGQPIIKRNDFTRNGNLYPRWDIYVDDLPDGGVTYLDGDLNSDGSITGDETRAYFRIGLHRNNSRGTLNNPVQVGGKHTFIVENASLNIIGDMVYDTPDSSLGIIVINDSIDDLDNLNRRGQLTVYKEVKHIVGALFTDGSFVSNVWAEAGAGGGRVSEAKDANLNNDWDVVNRDSRLGRQLILTGNILSKNTIGKADKAIPEGPWGDLNSFPVNERQARAQMYDFNYIRRYVPVYDSPGVLDTASKNRCSKIPGDSDCYENTKSFIIRVDPRLRENPPPGFQAKGIQSLR